MTTANVSTLARNEFTSGKLITAILVVRVGSQTSGHFAASDRRHQSSVLPQFETAVNGASQDSRVITTLTSQVVCLLLVLVVEALIGGEGWEGGGKVRGYRVIYIVFISVCRHI